MATRLTSGWSAVCWLVCPRKRYESFLLRFCSSNDNFRGGQWSVGLLFFVKLNHVRDGAWVRFWFWSSLTTLTRSMQAVLYCSILRIHVAGKPPRMSGINNRLDFVDLVHWNEILQFCMRLG